MPTQIIARITSKLPHSSAVKLILKSPAKTLQPAYRVQHVTRGHIERFKTELARLLELIGHSASESEEHLKNIVSDFLKGAYYRETYFVNTKDRQDLVIHNGRTAKHSVGVILEAKKPGNKAEMIAPDKPNTKALQELLRYYLNERVGLGNKEIRHLVITDIHQWYIFDAADFERHVYANTKLLKQYSDWSEGRLGAANTDWFYKEIAAPFFEKQLPELACCCFDLRTYAEAATNTNPDDDEQLLDLYKILSPEHLLKRPFANDSNALNKEFYDELLYILGLEEVKSGGKKIIDRADKRRKEGSLLENTLSELEVSGVWRDATGLDQFGDTPEYQRFSIALELCITWLNRILFLKLLEGQLLRWRSGGARLLAAEKVKDYDELNELFFHVLAVPENERRASVQQKFGDVPYLNSSLFEQSELERRTLRVSSLTDRLEMPLAPNTVLRDGAGKRREGNMNTLLYLFDFLDAYDFSSEAKARVQADNRAVINASVLGLIFEKINGYRDGSFFTPGFITMYMCRETLRRGVLQKFNEKYSWECVNVETDLYNALLRYKTPLPEANTLINSLHICDPAVGSGHFLVSALNELIAIKSELGILCDPSGKLLPLQATVGNDELIISDPRTDQPIVYQPGNTDSQRVQEALFHEKQTLIENCLFGVDINPKSVMICRLRLWIELLKHAYFTAGSQYKNLETLPNIDINIKSGNSLVSRFALDEDLKQALKKSKWSVDMYRLAVRKYHHATDKEEKRELDRLITEIKGDFRTEIGRNDPKVSRLQKLSSELYHRFTGNFLFEPEVPYGGKKPPQDSLEVKREQEKAKIEQEINKLSAEIDAIKSNKIFINAFEWRFEFPEVLDDAGKFIGFDVVLGNPPYIRQEELTPFKAYFQDHFETAAGTADLYVYFVERGMSILRQGGQFSYILPNKWMRAGYGDKLRQFVKRHRIEGISDFGDLPVFEEATTYPCVLELSHTKAQATFPAANIDTLDYDTTLSAYIRKHAFQVGLDGLSDTGWTLSNQAVQQLLDKLRAAGTPLGEYVQGKIYYGIKTGLNEAFVIDAATRARLIAEDARSAEVIKPFLAGRDIKRYQMPVSDKYLILFAKGVTNRERNGMEPEKWMSNNFPGIYSWLKPQEIKAKKRQDQGDYWWELRACEYYNEFENPKIIIPAIIQRPELTIDVNGIYSNDKTTIIASESKFLLAILNSRVTDLFMRLNSSTKQGGFFEYKPVYISQISIPNALNSQMKDLDALVTRILSAKQTDPQADTSALEAEVDGLVYGLYGLGEEEMQIIENQ